MLHHVAAKQLNKRQHQQQKEHMATQSNTLNMALTHNLCWMKPKHSNLNKKSIGLILHPSLLTIAMCTHTHTHIHTHHTHTSLLTMAMCTHTHTHTHTHTYTPAYWPWLCAHTYTQPTDHGYAHTHTHTPAYWPWLCAHNWCLVLYVCCVMYSFTFLL